MWRQYNIEIDGSEGCFESFKELVLDFVLRATYGNEGLYLLTISPLSAWITFDQIQMNDTSCEVHI